MRLLLIAMLVGCADPDCGLDEGVAPDGAWAYGRTHCRLHIDYHAHAFPGEEHCYDLGWESAGCVVPDGD